MAENVRPVTPNLSSLRIPSMQASGRFSLPSPEASPSPEPGTIPSEYNWSFYSSQQPWNAPEHQNLSLLTPPYEADIGLDIVKANRSPIRPTAPFSEVSAVDGCPDTRPSLERPRKRRQMHRVGKVANFPPSPDRFIPKRRSPTASASSFLLGVPTSQLSTPEKIARHNTATLDPFTDVQDVHSDQQRAFTIQLPTRVDAVLPSRTGNPRYIGSQRQSTTLVSRQASNGAVWNIGGAIPRAQTPLSAIPDGRGGMLGSGTNAPLYRSRFIDIPDQDQQNHEGRLAVALGFDRYRRVLHFRQSEDDNIETDASKQASPTSIPKSCPDQSTSRTIWRDGGWIVDSKGSLLDAPLLRDDFYCSVIAYCATTHSLAVALDKRVYIWSESREILPMNWPTAEAYHITSMAFSSEEGGHAVLGVGRSNGHLALWSTFEHEPRFEAQQPNPIASISWKPITTKRSSQREGSLIDYVVETEELLVGDETGKVYYYVIEWPDQQDRLSGEWHGSMKLLARISIHTQQICGISWSLDGSWFATGGNDNTCCLFQVGKILRQHAEAVGQTAEQYYMDEDGARRHMAIPGRGGTIAIAIGEEKHKWIHGAAVKAIAFCPWQKGLLATGGGSNDRCIHFYHVVSGACLATITVAAQVTSLIWSTTRREIAATFGYTQPEHPYRIAVFSWPDCRQVVAIPWSTDSRALYAVPYPMGSNEANERISSGEGGLWTTRSAEEGCIIVACSDQSIKFHEVWSDGCKTVGGRMGLLGGSAILESLEGIDKEGAEVIR